MEWIYRSRVCIAPLLEERVARDYGHDKVRERLSRQLSAIVNRYSIGGVSALSGAETFEDSSTGSRALQTRGRTPLSMRDRGPLDEWAWIARPSRGMVDQRDPVRSRGPDSLIVNALSTIFGRGDRDGA